MPSVEDFKTEDEYQAYENRARKMTLAHARSVVELEDEDESAINYDSLMDEVHDVMDDDSEFKKFQSWVQGKFAVSIKSSEYESTIESMADQEVSEIMQDDSVYATDEELDEEIRSSIFDKPVTADIMWRGFGSYSGEKSSEEVIEIFREEQDENDE